MWCVEIKFMCSTNTAFETIYQISAVCFILLLFANFCYIFHRMALDCACLLFTMFMGAQHVSALIEMHFLYPIEFSSPGIKMGI